MFRGLGFRTESVGEGYANVLVTWRPGMYAV